MEIDELDSPICIGCKVRDFKIEKMSIEITNLMKRFEHQKKLAEHFKALATKSYKNRAIPPAPIFDVIEPKVILELIPDDEPKAFIDMPTHQPIAEIKHEMEIKHENPTQTELVEEVEIKPDIIFTEPIAHPILKPFKCGKCNECFEKAKELRVHMSSHEKQATLEHKILQQSLKPKKKRYKCVCCDDSFDKFIELKLHRRKLHKKRRLYECFICKINTKSRKSLEKHIISHEKYEICVICFRKIKEREITQHLCVKEKVVNYINCEYCDVKTTSTKDMLNHLKIHKEDIKMYKCPDCPQFFEMKILMQYHRQYHAKVVNQFNATCQECSKPFKCPDSFKNHMRRHKKETCESNETNLCDQCGKSFKTAANLRAHIRTHEAPQLKCPDCPQAFYSTSHLKRHSYLHSDVKYVCPICGVESSSPYALQSHTRDQHGSKDISFECKICHKTFKNQKNRGKHMQVHKNVERFECEFCETTYKYRGDLNKHLKIHLGDEIYKCDQCERRFKLPKELQKHSFEHYKEEQAALSAVNSN